MKNSLFILLLVSILLVALFAVQLVPSANEQNIYEETHMVEVIYSPCCQDVFFRLAGDTHQNYINRGLEKNIDIAKWVNKYENKELTFTFIKFQPLFGRNLRSIAKIEFNNQIIYNAII